MDWNNILTLTGVFLGTAIAAYVGYSRKWPTKPVDPVLAGVGLGFGDKEQGERLISEMRRCADSLEVLADKRTDEMAEMHRVLLDRLDAQERREEQEEQRPRRAAPRRRQS